VFTSASLSSTGNLALARITASKSKLRQSQAIQKAPATGALEAEGLDLLQIGAPVFQVSFMIGLTGKYKYLPHDSHCLPRSVVGIELIAMPSCTLHL